MKETKREVAVRGIHYYNHFTSLEKVALAAAKTEKDRYRGREMRGGRGPS